MTQDVTSAGPMMHTWPTSLRACLPLVWQRVVCPGTRPDARTFHIANLALVLLLPALLLYPRSDFRLLEPDEGRYAEIAREMHERGDWIVPHLQGQPYLDKPPLLYWSVMASYRVFGIHDWSARLVPAMAIHLTILAAYLLGRRCLGERPAVWGAVLLTLAPGFMTMGRLLILDGLLACCTSLAILFVFEAIRGDRLRMVWWCAGAFAVGLGVLAKGPVALVLLVPPIWLWRQLQPTAVAIGWRRLVLFLGVVMLVNLPWYVAIGLRQPGFLRYFFWEHNVVRFVQPFDHERPIWFYLPVLIGGLLPGSLLTWWFGRFLMGSDTRLAQHRTPEFGFMLLAGGWTVAFFSLSGCKLPTYILPAFPFLALALGVFIAARWPDHGRAPKILLACGLCGMVLIHHVGLPWYAQQRSPLRDEEVVRKYCADPNQRVLCFPRSCDSLAFYLRRDDLRNVRSKQYPEIIKLLQEQPRTVVLFTHRHSLEALRYSLPPDLKIVEIQTFKRERENGVLFDVLATETPWGLCDLAVVERNNTSR